MDDYPGIYNEYHMTPKEEAEFTALATRVLEPNCSGVSAYEYSDKIQYDSLSPSECLIPLDKLFNMGMVIDAESTFLALCPNLETAVCLAELINYACSNRPFHNPEDPSIIRQGL